VNVNGEVIPDRRGWDGDARGPFVDEVVDVGEAVVARVGEVIGDLTHGEMAGGECFGTHSPDGSDPGKAGESNPLMSKVKPLARADRILDLLPGFEREESRVADEQGSVSLLEHVDGIGRHGQELRFGMKEFPEEDLRVCP